MSRDPILEEVRKIRENIAQEHDYNLDSIFEMFRQNAANSSRIHVNLSTSARTHTAVAAQRSSVFAAAERDERSEPRGDRR